MAVKRLEAIRFLLRAWRYRLKVEAEEIRHIRRSVSSGDTVIDVGAHKGAFTYWLSRAVGPQGRVLAFEPQPEVADYLRQATRYFRLDNVEILESALSTKMVPRLCSGPPTRFHPVPRSKLTLPPQATPCR